MDAMIIICSLLIVGHAVTIAAVMFNMTTIPKEFRQIVLEREETHRTLYAIGPDTESDSSDEHHVTEYM